MLTLRNGQQYWFTNDGLIFTTYWMGSAMDLIRLRGGEVCTRREEAIARLRFDAWLEYIGICRPNS